MNKFLLIQSFVCVVEQGTFTEAAKKLNRTKALVSTQIRHLEAYLQVKLFQRSTRHIQLTEVGSQYYKGCKALLAQWEALESDLCERQDNVAGLLRIAAPQNFGQIAIMSLVAEFLNQYPEVEIDLELGDRRVDVIQEGYDFTFRIGILEDSRLIALPLKTFDMIVCANKNYLQRQPTIKRPEDLKQHRCIVDMQHSEHERWKFYLQDKPIRVQVPTVLRVNNAFAAAQAAAKGIGITRIPSFAASDFLEQGTLSQVLKEYCQEQHTLYLMYPDKKYLSKRAQLFKEYIVEQFRK